MQMISARIAPSSLQKNSAGPFRLVMTCRARDQWQREREKERETERERDRERERQRRKEREREREREREGERERGREKERERERKREKESVLKENSMRACGMSIAKENRVFFFFQRHDKAKNTISRSTLFHVSVKNSKRTE